MEIYVKFDGELRKVDMKKLIRLILILLVLIIGLVVGIILIISHVKGKSSGQEAETVSEGDILTKDYYSFKDTELKTYEMPETALERLEESEPSKEDTLSGVYEKMQRDYPDFAGYLSIEGTKIDYPVMYSPEEPERYLHKDINGKDCNEGLPFIDARCSVKPQSDNIIIFGHNMRDGSMFGTLDAYKDKKYCEEHPVIYFDTPEGRNEYEVMAAFYDRVYYTDESAFRFYDFIDAEDKEDYDRSVERLIAKSLYETGVKAEYGDKLITLVTCSYQEENGRFALVARKSGNR